MKNNSIDFFTFNQSIINYSRPDISMINEEDIYLALKNIRRYLGQIPVTLEFHSILTYNISRLLSDDKRLHAFAAVHDLHEVYVGDVPTGLKAYLDDFKKIEYAFETIVHKYYGLNIFDKPKEVATYDALALLCETKLFKHPLFNLLYENWKIEKPELITQYNALEPYFESLFPQDEKDSLNFISYLRSLRFSSTLSSILNSTNQSITIG